MNSLRRRLLVPWTLSVLAWAAVAVLLLQLYRQSTKAQVQRADAVVARDCDLIRYRYGFSVAGWSGAGMDNDPCLRADLTTAVSIALAHEDGIEGGIWQSGFGPLAYAYPTYAGSGPKRDLPAAERDRIEAANRQVAQDEQPADLRAESRGETLLLHACPLPGSIGRLTAWTDDSGACDEGIPAAGTRSWHPDGVDRADVGPARQDAACLVAPHA